MEVEVVVPAVTADNLVVVGASNVEKKVISPGNAQMHLKEVIFKICIVYIYIRFICRGRGTDYELGLAQNK